MSVDSIRFESAPSQEDLYELGIQLANIVVSHHTERLKGRANHITVDLDLTDDPTHGKQQLSFFNGYYETWCCLPVVGILQFNNESEKYLFTVVLRPGNAPALKKAVVILVRIMAIMRFGRIRF